MSNSAAVCQFGLLEGLHGLDEARANRGADGFVSCLFCAKMVGPSTYDVLLKNARAVLPQKRVAYFPPNSLEWLRARMFDVGNGVPATDGLLGLAARESDVQVFKRKVILSDDGFASATLTFSMNQFAEYDDDGIERCIDACLSLPEFKKALIQHRYLPYAGCDQEFRPDLCPDGPAEVLAVADRLAALGYRVSGTVQGECKQVVLMRRDSHTLAFPERIHQGPRVELSYVIA